MPALAAAAMVLLLLEGAAQAGAPPLVRVSPDGGVFMASNALSGRLGAEGGLCLDFGMPRVPCARRWRDEGSPPVYQTLWEHAGVRYTQTVFLGRLDGGSNGENRVLLVRLTGENPAGGYTNATAAFSLQAGKSQARLELRDTLVLAAANGLTAPVAAVDLSPSANFTTNGTRLEFSGNMPPASSGSMTFKLPFALLGGEALQRLQDLDFDDELQREKKRAKLAPPPEVIGWDEPAK